MNFFRIRVGLLSEMRTRASIKNIDFVDSDVLEGTHAQLF